MVTANKKSIIDKHSKKKTESKLYTKGSQQITIRQKKKMELRSIKINSKQLKWQNDNTY